MLSGSWANAAHARIAKKPNTVVQITGHCANELTLLARRDIAAREEITRGREVRYREVNEEELK